MIGRHGPAFAFWLNYLDHHGGLWEQSGDTVLAILPGHLSNQHDLPESALITDDPDIAREDGVLFLGSGNPEIGKGAETIVAAGDVGALTLPHSAKQISTEDLLAKIRDQVPVDHGRIDATSSILRSHRPLLRLGALVSHSVSADEQFTEVAECLLDVPSRVAWAQDAADRLLSAIGTAEATAGPGVPANRLAPAVAAAHRELDTVAARRGRELSIEADAERVAEITRATEYYAAALAAIDKRRGGADAQRRALLDARAQATIGERDRRLAEISEKYRHQHVLRPYRLHLIDVPVWRLDTDVRRGERRWPMVFDYLPLLGTVAPTRCPTCDAHSPLVATKTHLGCERLRPGHNTAPPPGPGGRETAARRAARNVAADGDREPPRRRRTSGSRATTRQRPTGSGAAPPRPPSAPRRHRTRSDRVPPDAPFSPANPRSERSSTSGTRSARARPASCRGSSPPTRLWPPSPGSTARPGHCTGSAFRPVMLRCRSPTANYDRPVAGQRGGTAGRAAHPSRPVPVPAAVVAGQAPGRDLPLLGAVAPGPRPDASRATHPRSRAPHRPGQGRATPAHPRRSPARSDLRGSGPGRVVAPARSGRPARPLLPPRPRRDRGSGHSLLVGSITGRLPGCRRGLRRRPGRHPQGNTRCCRSSCSSAAPATGELGLTSSDRAPALHLPDARGRTG